MHERVDGKRRSSGNLSRRELLRRSAAVGAGAAALPLLSRLPAAAQDIPRAKSSATVTDRLQVLLKNDFHPDHNAFMRAELEAFAELNGWPIEITDVAGFQGGGDLNQKLLGGVQAGNQPDVLIHEIGTLNMHTLGLLEPVNDLVAEMIERNGEPIPGATFDSSFEGTWLAVPFFTRSNGLFVRQDWFAEAGLDVTADTDTYAKLRDAAMAISDPAQNRWGWGMTVNRSGDGTALVQEIMYRFGGHVQDETGQKITFNSPETIAAFEWIRETYSDERFAPMLPPGILSWTDTNNNEAYLGGQIGVTRNAGTVYAKAVLDKVPFADQTALIPSPTRNSDGARLDFFSSGMKFFTIKGAKNRDAVADVARHFLTQPVQERIWSISTGYALPAYTAGWDHPIIADNPNSVRAREMALTDTGFSGLPWPGTDNEALAAIGAGVYFTDLVSEILQGRPVEEVVADYHDQFVQIYQDFGRDGE